jgi:hypothetical protein
MMRQTEFDIWSIFQHEVMAGKPKENLHTDVTDLFAQKNIAILDSWKPASDDLL